MAAAMQHQTPQQHQQQQQPQQTNNHQYQHLHHHHHELHHQHHQSVHQLQLYQQSATERSPPLDSSLEPEVYYQPAQGSLGEAFTQEQQQQQHYSTSYEYNEQNHQQLLSNSHFRHYQQPFQQRQQHQQQQVYSISPRANLLDQGQEEHQHSSLDDTKIVTAPSAVLTELSSSKLSHFKPQETDTTIHEKALSRKRKRSASSTVFEEQQQVVGNTTDYSWCRQRLKSEQVANQSPYAAPATATATAPYLSITNGLTTNYEETSSPSELYYKQQHSSSTPRLTTTQVPHYLVDEHEQVSGAGSPRAQLTTTGSSGKQQTSSGGELNQLRVLEMRKEKSRDAARSRRSKENHEFYELAKLLPLPAAITSQLDFLDKASIIRLTISFLKLRQFSVNGHPPWAPDFTTLGSANPYSSQQYVTNSGDTSATVGGPKPATETTTQHAQSPNSARLYSSPGINNPQEFHQEQTAAFNSRFPAEQHLSGYQLAHQLDVPPDKSAQLKNSASLFDIHLGTHILQSLDGFAFAIGRDGRFLYISETVSMYLGLSQVEMTGSSVFDYTHQQDHEELARQLGIPFTCSSPPPAPTISSSNHSASDNLEQPSTCDSPAPASVHSQYSAASNETLIDDYINNNNNNPNNNNNMSPCSAPTKRSKLHHSNQVASVAATRSSYNNVARLARRSKISQRTQGVKLESAGQFGNSSHTSFNASTSSHQHHNKGDNSQSIDDPSVGSPNNPLVRQFCIRMKSTLTKRGCQHFKSSGYRVVHVIAHLRSYQSNDHGHLMDPLDEAGSTATSSGGGGGGGLMNPKQTRNRRGPKTQGSTNIINTTTTREGSTSAQSNNNGKRHHNSDTTSSMSDMNNGSSQCTQKIIGMVAVAIALPPPSINELRLESDTFVLKLAPDLRITHIEPRITELLNYPVEMMAGRSLYWLVHPADVMQLQKCHRHLLKKGQIMSGYYRLLARNGGYLWIQTCATLICNSSTGPHNQAGVLPPHTAPSPSVMQPQAIQQDHQFQHQPSASKMQPLSQSTNYLPPALFNTDQPATAHYSAPPAKLMSPGLSSSYPDTHQESDQCVIFVNYMITNVMESGVIMDICQSNQPAATFSTPAANQQQPGGNILFGASVPSPACSVGLLKSSNSANSSYATSYLSPSSTPMADINQRLNHSDSPTYASQFECPRSAEKLAASSKLKSLTNGRLKNAATGYKPKHHSSKTADEQVHSGEQDKMTAQMNFCHLLEPSANGKSIEAPFNLLNMNGHQDTSVALAYTGYPQQVQVSPSSGVNLALTAAAGAGATKGNSTPLHESTTGASWLSHHQQQQQHQSTTRSRTLQNNGGSSITGYSGAAAAAAAAAAASAARQVTGSGHYSPSMNHSIYKAAFGLEAASNSGSSNGYQQPVGASVYPAATQVNTSGFQSPQAGSGSSGTWDTASAAAAVAAANQQYQHHQPTAAHHQHHQTPASHPLSHPYAHHLESHHHLESAHSQAFSASAAAAAAAAAVAVNHHSATTSHNNYYNYCGYYGNKFI